MKKNHLVQISFVLLIVLAAGSCSKQTEKEKKAANITEEIPSYIQPINFHKPRTNCTSGFGFCVKGTWDIICVNDRQTYYSAITPDGIAHIWAQLLRGGLLEI